MAYILKDKQTGSYLIEMWLLDYYFEQTDDPNEATSYETYEDALGGIRAVAYYNGINAAIQICNRRP